MYPTIVTVEYWDEDARTFKSEGVLIYAESFAGAAEQIEDYYGHTIESMKIQMYEEGIFRVDTQHIKMIEDCNGYLHQRHGNAKRASVIYYAPS